MALMRLPALVVLLIIVAACGPTHTRGTKQLPKDQRAVLHVSRHNAIPGFHINAITIDGDQEFKITKSRDFYLTPGEHKIAVGYGVCIHGPPAWFSPADEFTLFKPNGGTTSTYAANKKYELTGWTEGIGSLMNYLHGVIETAKSE